MNSVDLIGRLTKNVDLKFTTTGLAVGQFTLAVNRDYTNKDGEREADFVNCVIWRKAAENLANFTKKGSQIGIQGKIQTRNYEDKEGRRVYVTEVIVDRFHLLDPKGASQGNTTNNNATNNTNNNNSNPNSNANYDANSSTHFKPSNPFGGIPVEIDDDELPF